MDETWVPYMRGKTIQRFTNTWDGEYIKYGENLAAPRSSDIFYREKIFVRQTGDSIIATIDENNVSNDTLHIIFSKDESVVSNKLLLGVLNSRLLKWVYQTEHPLEVGKPMAQVKKAFVETLPLVIDSTEEEKKEIERIVTSLLELCKSRLDKKRKFVDFIVKSYEPRK